ncbi:hypothetical protein TNIN_382691, partial [Trichonephila inaurata madagascariensis]
PKCSGDAQQNAWGSKFPIPKKQTPALLPLVSPGGSRRFGENPGGLWVSIVCFISASASWGCSSTKKGTPRNR